jgi:hypothetical protein
MHIKNTRERNILPIHLSQFGHPSTYLDACLATESQADKLFFTGLEKEAPVVDSVDLHVCVGILIVHWDAAGTEEGVYLGLLGNFGSGDGQLVVGERGEQMHCGFLLVWLDMGRRVTEKPGRANGESLLGQLRLGGCLEIRPATHLTSAFLAFVTFFSGKYMRKLTTHIKVDVIPLRDADRLLDGILV